MRLEAGQPAPAFSVHDINGVPITLHDYAGKKWMLSFYRHASCPLCNLRAHELIQRYPAWRDQGLEMLAFFQAPAESIRRYVGSQPVQFPIIADPTHGIYQAYGVEDSLRGRLAGFVHPRLFQAYRQGFRRGKPEGRRALIPADFLIGPDLTIHTAYYGATTADHLPFEAIARFLAE